MSYQWRFLLIEDKEDIAQQVMEAVSSFVDATDSAEIWRESNFKDGMAKLEKERFDILILDLKDDQDTTLEEHDVSAGLAIFEKLKSIRFAPVVFYTAHAHKVSEFVNPFVRVVEKSQGLEKLEEEVRNIMKTGLPQLTQKIEHIQREYMWEFAAKHWREFDEPQQKTDIAYLLTRRLSATLEIESLSLAEQIAADGNAAAVSGSDVHPMQMYVYPPIDRLQGGSLVAGKLGDIDGHWIVLTPTCDFVQKKAHFVLLARCTPLVNAPEYIEWLKNKKDASNIERLNSLIRDNRQKSQQERYKFLPGTFFIDDAVIDFQETISVKLEVLAALKHIASLDSPFAEALIGKFARYFGRLGTPDISKSVVINRLENLRQKAPPSQAVVPIQTAPTSH